MVTAEYIYLVVIFAFSFYVECYIIIYYIKEKMYQEEITMKGKSVKDLFKKTSVKIGSVVLAAAIVAGSLWAVNSQNNIRRLQSPQRRKRKQRKSS